MITATVIQNSVHGAAFDRRKSQRLKRAVQTELRLQGSATPIRVETADISTGGCYIEMAVTLELGSELELRLWLGHKKLDLAGKVVTRHPQFGNGIAFRHLSDDSRIRLQAFLDSEEVAPNDCAVSAIPEGLIV
ncbi:MAG: PilZ domain-containing protein [Candidatus Sulfotelmatobacter sp.]